MLTRIRKSMVDKEQGFTLLELLIVVLVIGLLAAIAIPVFLNQRRKAVDASMKSDLKNSATQVETWSTDNPGAPIDLAAIMPNLVQTPGNFVSLAPHPGGGYCIAVFSENSSAGPGGAARQMTYESELGGLQFAADGQVLRSPGCMP